MNIPISPQITIERIGMDIYIYVPEELNTTRRVFQITIQINRMTGAAIHGEIAIKSIRYEKSNKGC